MVKFPVMFSRFDSKHSLLCILVVNIFLFGSKVGDALQFLIAFISPSAISMQPNSSLIHCACFFSNDVSFYDQTPILISKDSIFGETRDIFRAGLSIHFCILFKYVRPVEYKNICKYWKYSYYSEFKKPFYQIPTHL